MCLVLSMVSLNWVLLVWIMFHLHLFRQHADDVGSWDTVNKSDEFLWRGLIHRKLELSLCSNVYKILVGLSPTFLTLLNSCCSQQMGFYSTDWYHLPESYEILISACSVLLQLIWWQFMLTRLYSVMFYSLAEEVFPWSWPKCIGCYTLLESGWAPSLPDGVRSKPKCCTDSSFILQQLPHPLSVSSAPVHFSLQLA